MADKHPASLVPDSTLLHGVIFPIDPSLSLPPNMEQCPVCMKIFASSNYLVSAHLHQSACRFAVFPTTNPGTVPTNSNMNEQITESSICIGDTVLPSNDVIQRPMQTNAFGDIIIAENDENSEVFAVFSESEDLEDQFMPPDPHDTNTRTDSGEQASEPEQSQNPISTILDQESFNVPVGSDDRLIPMLKMIKAVRAAGAPLSLLDTLVKIFKEEWQLGRMDITNLCTHKLL